MSEVQEAELELLAEVLANRPGSLLVAEVPGPAAGDEVLARLRESSSLPFVTLPLTAPAEFGSSVRERRGRDEVIVPRGLDAAVPFLDETSEEDWWSELNVLREAIVGGRARLLLVLSPRSLLALQSKAPDLEDWALRFSFPDLPEAPKSPRPDWEERIGAHGDTRRLPWLRQRLHEARERRPLTAVRLQEAVLPLLEELLHLGLAAEAQALWEAELGASELTALPPLVRATVLYHGALLADLQGRAEERLQRAQALRELTTELRQAWPEAVRPGQLHSVACTTLADCLQERGRAAEALELLEEALDLRRWLAEVDPSDPRRIREVGVTRSKIGEALVDLGRPEAALEQFQEALSAARALRQVWPESPEWRLEEGIARFQVGEALLRLGRLQEIPEQYRLGLELLRSVLAADPQSPSLLRHLSVAWGRFGDVLMRLGDREAASQAYEESSSFAERLLAVEPDSPGWRRDACVSWMRVADAALALGRLDDAERRYRKALETLDELGRLEPENVEWRRDLAIATSGMGDVALGRGMPEAALVLYGSADAILGELLDLDPKNPEWIRDRALGASKRATAFRHAGRHAEACATIQAARELLGDLLERNGQWKQVVNDLQGLSRQYEDFGCVSRTVSREAAGLVRERPPDL